MNPAPQLADAARPRLASLDQFRGYTVAGMLFVNFLGRFDALPAVFKHHNTYCSYADTIMPQFFLAVGFAYRLTLARRIEREGARPAYSHVIRRNLGLILLGILVYHLDGKVGSWNELTNLGLLGVLRQAFQREPFQTLVHIGLTSLWVAPVMARSAPWRWAFLLASATLHLALSRAFYFDWLWNRPGIDGGPLGFLSWTIPVLAGSFACDIATTKPPARAAAHVASLGALFMLAGYALSCLGGDLATPPFVPPPSGPPTLWTMSQRTGSISYQTFAAGFSLLVFALFELASDVGNFRPGLFRVFGRNALVIYLLQGVLGEGFAAYAPKDSPAWYMLAVFSVYLAVMYAAARHLEREGLFLKM